METIELNPERIEAIETPNGKILPGGEGKYDPKLIIFTNQDHPFLQKFIEAGLMVYRMHDESTIEGYYSAMVIQIYKDHINLECISTHEKNRRCGNGRKLMQQLIDIADETGIILRATVRAITPQVNTVIPIHPVVVQGATAKKKIPARQLPKWFKKFGFIKLFDCKDYIPVGACYMERKSLKK